MEEIEKLFESSELYMQKTLEYLKKTFSKIRTGKASPAILETLKLDYFNVKTPLNKLANISFIDNFTINIQPWDRKLLSDIDRAIRNANLGVSTVNNGDTIIITFPPLTEERRKELVKKAKLDTEKCKISLRKIRKDANRNLKHLVLKEKDIIKSYEDRIQKLTSEYIKKASELFLSKEKDILLYI